MAKPQKIPKKQLERVHKLELQLEKHVMAGDLKRAKLVLNSLKEILTKYNHNARIQQAYLKLYEGALETWDLDLAKRGLQFVREHSNRNTRNYLEATTLLAIAHLRQQDIFSAEPLISEVLRNDDVIKSEARRTAFRREIIERFDEEGALSALAACHPEIKNEAQIHKEAIKLLKEGNTEDDLHEILGASIPQSVKDFLLKIDGLSKNLLTYDERLLLPSPKEIVKNKTTGSLIFKGLRRRLYKYVCDDNSEVYQAWLKGGLDAVLNKGYITSAVLAALADIRIGLGAVAVGASALLMKSGLNNFCAHNKPFSLLNLRKK